MYSILAVDDREIFLTELKRFKLWGDKSGFDIVSIAQNGREALTLLKENSYDLVLTDIRMPIIDGLQLLREIQKENLCSCVVILSEYREFNYARQGIVFGAFDYLVKPVTENKILELLNRIKIFLDNKENNSNSIDLNFLYSEYDEKQIIKYLLDGDGNAVKLWVATIEKLYLFFYDNIIKADMIMKKIYSNIIEGVYKNFQWLNKYIHRDFFEIMDYIHEGNENASMEFYTRKLKYLLDFLKKVSIKTSDGMINNICDYILNNIDSDLKLKFIAKEFYVNSTYLSNTFAIKTSIGFRDYITIVKMARAEYLFVNTKLKNYEVAHKLGFRDINYFSKLFKRYYGKNPSQYKGSVVQEYQI
ncbi:response regulator [Clostridium butyricum]|uniref:response regulator transcription factor n=1 Tax=Clostridium butyricum TaxID=1492 RepID=UPI001CA9531A|nr:response regulator [Clostridium butyricum]MBZ0313412.1 response regulator [Clostridium butyricum]